MVGINIKEYDPNLPLFTFYINGENRSREQLQLHIQNLAKSFRESNIQTIILVSDKDDFVCTHSGFGNQKYKDEISGILAEYDDSPNSVQDTDDLISNLRSVDRKIKLDFLEIN